MRIYYFIDSEIPTQRANMVHAMKMCRAFAKNGVDVTLFCNCVAQSVNKEQILEQYNIEDCFEIRTVRVPKILSKYGHRFGAYFSAFLKARVCPDNGFVYSRSAMSLFFCRKRMEYIYESHLEPDVINRCIEKSVLRHRNCRGLVTISQTLKERYLELFPFMNDEDITVLHDGADEEMTGSATKAALYEIDSEIKIGYIGSLFPGKCMETLIPLAGRCVQYRFHVLGGNEYWVGYWKKQAEKAGVNNIVFYGYVANNRVKEYYRAFDVCILPFSKDIHIGKNKRVNISQWTSPLKLFEAMAYGKPIIVSRLTTIEEVMTDGVDCVMVEPDDIDDWVQKLNALCADRELRERIGYAAHGKLTRNYTWSERARRAAELFE